METNIPNYDLEPDRKSRANWLLIGVIILLCSVTFVQGLILFGMKTERGGRSLDRAWHERLQKLLPGQANKARQAALSPLDNQVIFWEPTDDLEQIHDQINRLLRNMTAPRDATMANGPFPAIAIQRKSGNRSAAMPTSVSDLDQLQREIEQIFEDAYNESQESTLLSRFNHGWDMVSSAAAMNIEDQGSNYVVMVTLPGYDKQGIKISLEGHLLIIDAAQTYPAQAAATRTRAGQFHTQIMMPENIAGDGVQAAYEHDVLCVHIPKAEQTNSLVRSIAIR